MKLTQDAKEYAPFGDPDHAAYGKDFSWRCSCGRSSHRLTDKRHAKSTAKSHERYCTGETTVYVNL